MTIDAIAERKDCLRQTKKIEKHVGHVLFGVLIEKNFEEINVFPKCHFKTMSSFLYNNQKIDGYHQK